MKRSALGPGRKSLDRGSTFATRGSALRRNRRRQRGRPTDEQILAKQRAWCFLAQFSDESCFGEMRLCHLISAQRLRAAGVSEDDIWDKRILVNGCDGHHYALDIRAIDPLRIPRTELPPGAEEYAAEHGLVWSLDRDYGPVALNPGPYDDV